MENSRQSAFPFAWESMGEDLIEVGLTKREYFAAKAMESIATPRIFVGEKETQEAFDIWAKLCVRMADELLNQLSK